MRVSMKSNMNTTEHSGPITDAEAPQHEDSPMTAEHMTAMNIRMSRISHPRATWFAFALLIVVFLTFGIWAEASLPEVQSATPLLESGLAAHYPWLGKITAILGV